MGDGGPVEIRRFFLLLFLVSLVVRASLMIPVAGADIALQADENEYFSRAAAFKVILTDAARGKPLYSQDISRAYGGGTFPPVHSLYLALSLFVAEDATLARWAVVLLSSLTTPLVYLLTLHCSTRKAALAAAGVHVFYPSFVAFSHYLWSETTYIFLLLLATYFTLCLLGPDGSSKRATYALLAGCFLGLAALTRAAGLPFLFVLPAWTYLSLRKTSGAASKSLLLLAASAIVVSPWEAALASREARLVPLSTAADYNLFVGNNPWEMSDRFEPDTKPLVAAAIDGLGWTCAKASVWMGGAIAVLGIPAAWNTDVLGVMDSIANNLLLLAGGLLLAVFVGWFMRDPVSEARQGAEGVRWFFLWRTLLRFVAPLFLLYVLFDAVPGTLRSIAALFFDY